MEKRKTNIILELIDGILLNTRTLKNTYNKSYKKSMKEKEY